MRQYRSWALLSVAALGAAATALAQVPEVSSNPERRYDGWQSAPRSSAVAPSAKRAYFQAPLPQAPAGQLPDVSNTLAGSGLPAFEAQSFAGQGAIADRTVQPAGGVQPAFDQFANPGGHLPATDVRPASGSELRDAPAGSLPVYPPPGYAQPGNSQFGSGGQILPPNGYAPSAGGQTPQSSLRSIQPQGQPGATYSTVSQQQQVAHNGMAYTIPVVSQDPRFISPPPSPRVGNFATLPYSPNRLAGYQVNPAAGAQTVQAQTVQAPLTQASQPAVVANTSTLPQYQPTVGIHPTAYQAGYQYCAPGIPSGGVPQLVPGAVAPPTLPPNLTPQLYTPDNAGFKPLFSLGQENYNVQLGRGIIGQPTVYVPGQPVRNFLRYISP